MAEGFIKARPLAIKFVTLYALSADLLSKQPHYDWGLRAVKSVLRVAGNLKRAEPQFDEEAILMRALRDFNTPKIPLNDLPIFMRLIAGERSGLPAPRSPPPPTYPPTHPHPLPSPPNSRHLPGPRPAHQVQRGAQGDLHQGSRFSPRSTLCPIIVASSHLSPVVRLAARPSIPV